MQSTSPSGSVIGLTMFTGLVTGAAEFIMSGLQDIGNGTIITYAGTTVTTESAIKTA